jgi:RND family efflux transporter MFP subunit
MSRPARHAELSFTIGGRVDERPVDIGDEVEAGQVLARLDPRPLENQLKAAQASVREVRAHLGRAYRDRRRTYDLSKAEVTSSAQLDEATSSVRALRAGRLQASAQLDEAKRMLEEATMRAPFAGTVSEVLIEPGEFATPGRPVIILSGGGGLEVEVEVPESEIHHIERGSSVEVDFPLAGKEGIEGSVKQVGRTTARVGRVFPVVVRLHEPEGVVPGMAAEVSFAIQRDRGLSVPVAAVINPGGQHPAVFRVVDGRVERVDVEVLELVDDRVTVVGGLEPDDRVVVGGHGGLVEGERVLVGNAPLGGSEPTGSEPTGPEPTGSEPTGPEPTGSEPTGSRGS